MYYQTSGRNRFKVRIPHRIEYKVSDADAERLDLFLSRTFWCNSVAFVCHQAAPRDVFLVYTHVAVACPAHANASAASRVLAPGCDDVTDACGSSRSCPRRRIGSRRD